MVRMAGCRDLAGPQQRFPALECPGTRALPMLPLLSALLSLCANTPAGVAKGSNNRHEETKSLQGIPDATVLVGKIFYYPVPVSAFQGMLTHYKVTLASGADLPQWLDFNPSTNMLQGLPMSGETGAHLLSIAASGRMHGQQTLRAAGNLTIHIQDSTLHLDTEGTLKHMPNSYQCEKEVPITTCELILSTGAESLGVQERLSIVGTMAEYLHLHSSLLTLLQYTASAHRASQGLAILAADTGHINFTLHHYVGLSWPLKCGGFAMLQEFLQVLRHNIDSHNLSQLLGYQIAGWRILRRGDSKSKSPRRQYRQLMITPTPTLKPIRVTQRPAEGDAHKPLFPTVPSHLLIHLVVPPTQSLPSCCEERIMTTSSKMQNYKPFLSQSLVTSEMDSAWHKPPQFPGPSTLANSHLPDLSPSLLTKTPLFFTELEVLPTPASGMSWLIEQPQPHVPGPDSHFLSSKSDFLQAITPDTEQLSSPMYTWVTNTLPACSDSSAQALPSKTELQGFLSGGISGSAVPDYSDEAKSHIPELEVLPSASLSPETLPSGLPTASLRATTLSDFPFPISDTLPLVPARQVSTNDCQWLAKPSTTIPQPSGFPFAAGRGTASSVTQGEAESFCPKVQLSTATSASFSSMLHSTFILARGAAYEASPIILPHPAITPALTLPVDFSKPPKPLHCSDSSSLLSTEMQPASLSSSSTRELHSTDRDLRTRGTWPSVTELTLELHKTSDIHSDAAEVPLETLFHATSHLSSSIPEVVQTPLPSHQEPSTLLSPTSERLQAVASAWILPPSSVSQELQTITPGQANTSPKVVHSIQFLTATMGCLFFFPIPANTFHDEEDGNSAQLSLQITLADGSPLGSESWLQFNTSQQTMNGYPLEIDFQYSPQELVLSATDSGGLTAWQPLTIELLKPTREPCHLYTIRTKTSYYSFLRERKRLALFLEKLSLYLNCSSPKDITVSTLKAGSTVIAWYNSSLCTSTNTSSSWCGKEDIQQALEKLRVPDGSVSPQFAQAMLPEYTIDGIVNISYSEACLVPTLQDKNDSTSRKSPAALLSSLCPIAGVILGTLLYCFCKHLREIPATSQSNSQLSHAEVELDALRAHKVPVHECRAFPPPQLWMPPLGSLTSQEQHSRLVSLPPITPPLQPPRYQLPPLYQGVGLLRINRATATD